MKASDISDLRDAVAYLRTIPGQFAETDVEADPVNEILGVYKKIGGLGTVSAPTREGPMAVFNNVKGYPGCRVAVGVLSSRRRVGYLLGQEPERRAFFLRDAVHSGIPPVTVPKEKAPCQEHVILADEPGFDLRKILPVTQATPDDAGPCITMGLCMASDPETGHSDVTIHRMFPVGPDELTFNYSSIRHIGMMYEKAQAMGKPLPISISIGLDPAVYMGTSFEAPTTPYGYNELDVAGAVRGRPVELVDCVTIPEKAVANAEYVIEGELLPDIRVSEDHLTGAGGAIPEFPGYVGHVYKVPVIKVRAVTHRTDPIYQTCIGASEEHVNMAGIPTEACIINAMESAMPGRLVNVYAHSAGGGKYMAILQLRKIKETDEGRERQAGIIALATFAELKHVILVDEDVDPFDSRDVLWAMNTRFQADRDVIYIPYTRCHRSDPSSSRDYNPLVRADGAACKAIFDCTVPLPLKKEFRRATFMDVDADRFFPGL